MTIRPLRLSIGQEIMIVNYDHPHCGRFARVITVSNDGQAGSVELIYGTDKWCLDHSKGRIAVTPDQVINVVGSSWK